MKPTPAITAPSNNRANAGCGYVVSMKDAAQAHGTFMRLCVPKIRFGVDAGNGPRKIAT